MVVQGKAGGSSPAQPGTSSPRGRQSHRVLMYSPALSGVSLATPQEVVFVPAQSPDVKKVDPVDADRGQVESPTTLWKEVKASFALAIPMVLSTLLEFIPFTTSAVLVGHMDSSRTSEYIAASSLSYLVLSLTGVSVGFGLLLDTLCPQSVGAGKMHNIGMYLQTSVLTISITFIPIFILNWNVEAILIALNQQPEIAALAGRFNRWAVVGLPGVFLYTLIQKGVQAQEIVAQMVWITALDNVLYIGLGYWLCFHTSMAMAMLYLLWNPVYKQWWPPEHPMRSQWKVAWLQIPNFLKLGVPGMAMSLIEQLAFDMTSFTMGWLPNPELSLAVHNVLLTINTIVYAVYIGVGTSCCILLGNALGANEPNRGRLIAVAGLVATFAVFCVLGVVFLATRKYLPQLFINDPIAIEAYQDVVAIYIVFMAMDGLNSTCQSILRGMGQLSIGAYVNAAAFYLVGLPLVGLLAFQVQWDLQGTWVGLSSGLSFGSVTYLFVIYRTDWRARADEAVALAATDKEDA